MGILWTRRTRARTWGLIAGTGLGVIWAVVRGVTAPAADQTLPAHPFHDNVKVTVSDDLMIVESDGIPTHKTGTFPNATNPNRILKQDYKFFIPRHPQKAERTTPTPFGPIGVALNGIPFYNQYNAMGRDAVSGPFAEVFDSCCGHPDPEGRYHYHKYPVCVKSPFRDPAGAHSPLIGYAFDGFALYGPNDSDGKPPTDLDECNGHEDKERGYHYHVTAKFPYLVGAYRGVPDGRNFQRPRGGMGRGRGPGGPPPHPLEIALDKDRDGVISAEEIAQAPASLKSLDGDRNGRLTRDEFAPPPPPGRGGPGVRPGRGNDGRGPGGGGPADGPPGFGPPDGPPPFGPPGGRPGYGPPEGAE